MRFETANQPRRIGRKIARIGSELKAIHPGKLFQALRQVRLAQDFRVVHIDRHDRDAALQRRLDLDAHEIVRAVDPAAVMLVHRGEPAVRDQREQQLRLAHLPVQIGAEVHAERNAVYVHEHRAGAEFRLEMPGERIVDQRGDGPGIVPPVGDENLAHECRAGKFIVQPDLSAVRRCNLYQSKSW